MLFVGDVVQTHARKTLALSCQFRPRLPTYLTNVYPLYQYVSCRGDVGEAMLLHLSANIGSPL